MATLATRLTVEEFDRLPELFDGKRELVDGEVVEMAGALFGHELIKSDVAAALNMYASRHSGWKVFSETKFRLTPFDSRQPDVALLSTLRVGQTARDQHPEGAPELVIEVVSSESASDLESKVELYLATGAKQVWVIYPEQRVVWVYREGSVVRLRHTDTLETPDFLPGFSLPLQNIFSPQSVESPRQ